MDEETIILEISGVSISGVLFTLVSQTFTKGNNNFEALFTNKVPLKPAQPSKFARQSDNLFSVSFSLSFTTLSG